MRRATVGVCKSNPATADFYPRSPCGERLVMSENLTTPSIISIHALLAESDAQVSKVMDVLQAISIHALLAESDSLNLPSRPMDKFLSTLSLRRATPRGGYCYLDNIISIHALLAESDGRITPNGTKKLNFYPRSPCGERPHRKKHYCLWRSISIHALLAESDR